MASNDGSVESQTVWPLPKFSFSVNFGTQGENLSFQEVSGLETETQVIEYRHSNSNVYSPIKMPGLAKVGNAVFTRGIFVQNNDFWRWYSQIKMNTIPRQTVTISLLDENGKTTMQWTLSNAWPTKIVCTNLNANANEVAIDTLEVAFETMRIKNK